MAHELTEQPGDGYDALSAKLRDAAQERMRLTHANTALNAENERLRASLLKIADGAPIFEEDIGDYDDGDTEEAETHGQRTQHFEDAQIARKALGGAEVETCGLDVFPAVYDLKQPSAGYILGRIKLLGVDFHFEAVQVEESDEGNLRATGTRAVPGYEGEWIIWITPPGR